MELSLVRRSRTSHNEAPSAHTPAGSGSGNSCQLNGLQDGPDSPPQCLQLTHGVGSVEVIFCAVSFTDFFFLYHQEHRGLVGNESTIIQRCKRNVVGRPQARPLRVV